MTEGTTAKKSALERFLNLFTEVRGGEGNLALLMAFNIFLLLSCYYLIKPVRDALILAEGGAEAGPLRPQYEHKHERRGDENLCDIEGGLK